MSNATSTKDWVGLEELEAGDREIAGGKAARLSQLMRAGFQVPEGFVLTTRLFNDPNAARHAIAAALPRLGEGTRVAVRSSAVAEDLEQASFAGQYESVLGVAGEGQVLEAVKKCWASASEARVEDYSRRRAGGRTGPLAVLVQRLVEADAAGVAYSANPVTGARDEVTVSAVRGLGERLVSGNASPDEWVVRGDQAQRLGGREDAIDAAQALAVAKLARHVADLLGSPQDIEWAIDTEHLHLVQSRPMTGLPDDVSWECPAPGGFARNFRFGEWIGDPVTPLFESWLLSTLEEGLHDAFQRMTGLAVPRPYHVVVNGWYFYELPPMKPGLMIRALPRLMPKLLVQPRRVAMMMPFTAHFGIELYVNEWRELGLPSHLNAVSVAEKTVDTAAPVELIDLIDSLARAAGNYFEYITAVAGFAAKAEMPLGKFYRQHLHPLIGGSHLELLQGLVRDVEVQPHAVLGLDWYFPTVGELAAGGSGGAVAPRDLVTANRREAEARARAALAGNPKLAKRFESLLAVAQRFQPVREECLGHLTRGWPVMRRALARLGGELTARDVLGDPAEVHFLAHDELVAAIGGASGPFPVAQRRAAWERQRRLSPPLIIGEVTKMMGKILDDFAEATRSPSSAEGIRGVAASPGLATGPVRVLRDASDFERLQPGDVLVAQATTPAWTPLFARAVAVVTDTGSIGSHASQVAREYGIPAVVCTVDATRRLKTGQLVTVDGSAGVVVTAG